MVDFLIKTIKGAMRLGKGAETPKGSMPVQKAREVEETPPPRRRASSRPRRSSSLKATEKASPTSEVKSDVSEKKSGSSEEAGDRPARRRRPRRRRSGPRPAENDSSSDAVAKKTEAGKQEAAGRTKNGQTRNPRSSSRGRSGDRRSPSRKPRADEADIIPAPRNMDALMKMDEDWDPASFQVAAEEGKTRFHDLSLHKSILHAIADLNFKYCTPIQAELLTHALEGRDAKGQAQTGTGKTAAFLIASFNQLLSRPRENPRPGTPRVLVLAPTRELVIQLEKDATDLGKYLPFRYVGCYGGTGYKRQEDLLSTPVDMVMATPGRLIDFCRRKILDLSQVEILVIDEADRMLDMGFIPDVKQIVYMTPPKEKRQTLFFSATLTGDVHRLAASWTKNAVTIEIEPESIASERVDQKVFIITADQKPPLLCNLLAHADLHRVIVFTNRRDQAERLAIRLYARGFSCALLSGALPQNVRTRTLEAFRAGEIDILVATDVAGRGIHIDGISHVINYNLPLDPEDYVHRIGRTGRAGHEGTSISFACEEESFHLPDIEQYMGRELPCVVPPEELLAPLSEEDPARLKEAIARFGRRAESSSGGSRPRRSGVGSPRSSGPGRGRQGGRSGGR